jgi:hypothetical protein
MAYTKERSMDWYDEAIDAAWIALVGFGGDRQLINKEGMKAALNAGCEAQRKKTSEIMNQRLLEKIKELEADRGNI